MWRIITAIFTVLTGASLALAITLHVPSQYPTVQAGIDAAVDGDTVLVADGTYTGEGNKSIDFTGKAILVTSENGPENCIIDCEGDGRGFHFHTNENPNSILSGFKIINGWTGLDDGGGICCELSSPTIANCILSGNSAYANAGGISCEYSSPTITGCTFINNWTVVTSWESGGGAVAIWIYSNPTISNCTFIGNSAGYGGGGIIIVENSHPTISDCNFSGNRADHYGGGIGICDWCNPTISNCTFSENSATDLGGGLWCETNTIIAINKCIFSENEAASGGGVYCQVPASTIVNCILWENSPDQIQGSSQVTYCDVMGGWPGMGNIDEDPLFVYPTQNDFRLQWGSPCIDAGDPDPIYNDPDGTAADMGAFYYDQSMPLRILLTPFNAPIQIPPDGGTFDYAIRVTNIDPLALNVDAWCDVTLPDGSIVGPVLGPVNFDLGSEVTISRERTQTIPAGAPTGVYFYNAYAIAEGDTSVDGFTFVKLGVDGLDRSLGWFNTGEQFSEKGNSPKAFIGIPEIYCLNQNYPNPFNPVTTIRYGLPKDAFVKLTIYDLLGRQVVVLVDCWRQAGQHEVSFDAGSLASGLYVYRIEAGEFTAVRKMILMK